MTRSRHSEGLASPTTRVWPRLTPTFARCASRMALMKSTIVRLRATNCADTPTRRLHRRASGNVAQGVKQDEEYAGVKPIEERHRIDEASLDRWMRRNIERYVGPPKVLQFKGGQSNPTYRLDTPGASYVLCRKPFGKLLPSAQSLYREFRVISGLAKQGFPVRGPI